MGSGSRYTGIEVYRGKEGVRWIGRASRRLPNGQRVYFEESHPTEAAANRARREWLTAQDTGKATSRSKATVADALRLWLESFVVLKAPATRRSYEDIVRRHLLGSPIAGTQLMRLDTATIQGWYNTLTHLSAHRRSAIHQRLCQALDMAVSHKRMADNPARACTVPPYERGTRGAALTDEQVAIFLRYAARDHYRPFWQVAIATGLRRGELLGLRWRDVDFRAGTLTVRQTVIWVRRMERQDRAKNRQSLRTIGVGAGVLDLLWAHKARQSRWSDLHKDTWADTGAVFSSRWGKYLQPTDMVRAKRKLLARAGLPATFRIHDLRHTAISHLINSGVPIPTIVQVGGYRNASVLFSVYAHANPNDARLAVAAQDSLLRGGDLTGTRKVSGLHVVPSPEGEPTV